MKPLRLLGMLALAAGLAGCGDSPTGSLGDARQQLEAARQRWQAAALDDYDYAYQYLCRCVIELTEPVRITVRADTVATVTIAETNEPANPDFRRFYLTVDQVFALIEDAIDRQADQIAATFHPDLGYPAVARIDYRVGAAGEEIEIRIAELRAAGAQ